MKPVKYPALPILMVDDEEIMLNSFRRALNYGGINHTLLVQDSRDVPGILAQQSVGVILLDILMPHLSGDELLEIIAHDYPQIPVIIITGIQDVETAVKCMRAKAYDYLVKPVDEDRLISAVNRAIEYRELQTELHSLRRGVLSDNLAFPDCFKDIVTRNREMLAIFHYIEAVAASNQPVLVTGETGVGKELIAGAIHGCSQRAGEFIKINVAGLDDTMFSDTLFGHKKGAFTGAEINRDGLVAKTANGTLFLDEICDLNETSQIKLLRLLQEREYFPLGADEVKQSRSRIIVASNKDLNQLTGEGRFRKDLYFRLNAHHIHLPALRERLDDLPLLLNHFLDLAAEEFQKPRLVLDEELIAEFSGYHFPGNIRELKARVFDAVARHKSGKMNVDLFTAELKHTHVEMQPKPSVTQSNLFAHLKKLPTIQSVSEMLIEETLKRTQGNKSLAAQILGITRQTIAKYDKLKN